MHMINYAIRHLAKKTYSERELRELLEAQYGGEFNLDKAIEETINYLRRYGLIDDERLALHVASSYTHKGDKFIRNTLYQRKIKSEQICTALNRLPDEYTRAWEETKKRLAHALQCNSKNEQINTVARFLAGRQFSHPIINKVIEKLNSKFLFPIKDMTNSFRIITS